MLIIQVKDGESIDRALKKDIRENMIKLAL